MISGVDASVLSLVRLSGPWLGTGELKLIGPEANNRFKLEAGGDWEELAP